MSEPDLTEAESFLRFISTEGGGAVLHQVRAYLTGGEASEISNEVRSSMKNLEAHLKKTSEIRKFASQICQITATVAPVNNLKIPAVAGHIHRYELPNHQVGKLAAQQDILTRTSVGGPLHKMSQVVVERQGVSYQIPRVIEFNIGDIVLVWWGSSWSAAMVQEVGGESSLAMRTHILGREDFSDIWINEKEWAYRVRKVITPINVCLSKGYLGKIGEKVRVKVVDPTEIGFWQDEYPIGVVIGQLSQYDSVKVEVNFLSHTEIIVLPNSFCAAVGAEAFEETRQVIVAARVAACRLIEAFHADAQLTDTHLSTNSQFHPAWITVWQGICKVSGLRVLACVSRRGGKVRANAAQCPECQVRITDPVTRRWRVSQVPKELLKGCSALDWDIQGTKSRQAVVELMKHARLRNGKLVWGDPPVGPLCISRLGVDDEIMRVRDGCLAPGHSYPSPPLTSELPIASLKKLVLKEVEVDVHMFAEIGGGDVDDDDDGVRLIVQVMYSETLTVEHVFFIWRQDWQGFRPWGLNGGSLPGLRCIDSSHIPSLLRYIVNRMDVYEGCPVLRFPHRSAYPLEFLPFQGKTPPSGEAQWSKKAGATVDVGDVLWRSSLCLNDGVGRSRWNISVKRAGPYLILTAMSISHQTTPLVLHLSLSVMDWGVLGIGPRQWLSVRQQQHLCRRLLCRHSHLLQLNRISENNSTSFTLSAHLQPVTEAQVDNKYDVQVRDVGTVIEMKVKSMKSNSSTTVWLSGRDLHSCCPSLHADHFSAAPSSMCDINTPVGLGPFRSCYLRSRNIRPGMTRAELSSDLRDAAACWEETRLAAAVRDMEPLARLAMIQRLIASLRLDLLSISQQDEETIKSCAPPLPSHAHYEIDTCLNGFSVTVSPPGPLCRGGGAIEHCVLSFEHVIGEPQWRVVRAIAPKRGVNQKTCFTISELGECCELWLPSGLGRSQRLVESLVSKLQHRAGCSHTYAQKVADAKACIDVAFPPQPLALFVHEVRVNFVRSDPLIMQAFDTGSGVLLISSAGGKKDQYFASSDWETPISGELGRYMVPRAEMGEMREPLLMSGIELDRLMLGHSRSGHDARSGVDKATFLSLTLEQALSLDSNSEQGRDGLAKWAAPLVTGVSMIGVVCHLHTNGFVDVRLSVDGRVQRCVDPALLKVPIRPDRMLHSYGRARCWSKLSQRSGRDEYDHLHGLVPVTNMLYVGATVEVQDKCPLLSTTHTMKSLHYHRGSEEYEKVTTRNAEPVVAGSLPEHLALLLTDDATDMSFVVHESASLDIGSSRIDTGYLLDRVDDGIASNKSETKHTAETPEMVALRERRQAAATMFYSKQFKSFVAKGEDLFQRAEALNHVLNIPQPKQMDEDSGVTNVSMIDRGETEAEARQRVLQQRRYYEEAAQCFRFALRRTPTIDPKLYGRVAVCFHRARDFRASLVNCGKALSHFPNSPRVYFLQGQALLELKRVDEAFVSFDRALVIAKELREKDDDTSNDIPLIEAYRRSAYLKKHKFVDKETLLGDIEVESDDPVQRDIDENLNMFNVYDSVPALTTSRLLPDIEVASKMVNPIGMRLKYRPPPHKLRKSTKKLKRSTMKLPDILKPEDQVHGNQGSEGEEELFRWEEDTKREDDEDDLEVIIEMEIETESEVLELCLRKNDDVAATLDSFFKENHELFTHAQMRELRVELRSRLGEQNATH